MDNLSTDEIYKIWRDFTKDPRYLRRRRWAEIAKVISHCKLTSALEFGCGISSLLFDNLGLKVDSFETDPAFMADVEGMCSDNVKFHLWDNETRPKLGYYDIALVDGCLPRNFQLELAIEHADFVAIDDCSNRKKEAILAQMSGFERLDSDTTFMTVFRIN